VAFENHQQDAFNLRNDTESLKQWQSELDKATTAIGAAEVAAEEELAALKFKNLVALQDAKVAKLEQLIALEDKGIRELAKARLTLSDRQFEIRKKEIQKEFQMAKNAAEELLRIKNKKTQTSTKKSASATKDITAATKARQPRVTIADKDAKKTVPVPGVKQIEASKSAVGNAKQIDAAKSADISATDLASSIDGTLASLRDTITEQSRINASQPKENASTTTAVANTEPVETGTTVQIPPVNVTVEQPVVAEPTKVYEYSSSAEGIRAVDLGKYALNDIRAMFEASSEAIRIQNSDIETALNSVTANNGQYTSQASIDIACELLENFNSAENAIRKIREFNENRDLNERLTILAEEQKIRAKHEEATFAAMTARIAAEAKTDDIKNNRDKYLAEAEQKLKENHAKKLNELNLAGIDAEAKANDLENNRKVYEFEARLARENAFYEKRNELEEGRIGLETELAWERAHTDEIMAQELQQKRLSYLKEYQEHLKKAGKYGLSQEEFEKIQAKKDRDASRKDAASGITTALTTNPLSGTHIDLQAIKQSYSEYMGQRTAELKDSGMGEASAELTAKFELLAEVSGNLAQQLNAQTDKIGAKQAPVDTRLQGSTANDKILGSYWKQLARDMNKIGAVNPYFKQEDFANNIEALVNRGISFDIKQRAFLMTIQEKIANTFDAADGTLLRLVRIQQQDTTAGRLGMESALNSFLNSMYETSEYLSDVASSVRSSLGEMQALMEGAAATELEFQVQKWMGSLYSVGMSQDAVQSIAQTFGQIASGDISGLTGSGTGNLLIMAANEAGMSIADILQDGLNADETNKLMQAMVNYLAEIAETSSDSRVVQQQLANVYGMKASDLRAATNLATSIKDVSKQDLTYSGMLGQLNKMANSMYMRTSTGEMLTNVWDNVQYTMATQMSNDPVLYLLPRIATLLEDYAGGIDLPFVNVMGFGVDLNTSVAQLMNVAAMGGSILGALGPMISGLSSAASGSMMLSNAGINTSGKAPIIARGSAQPLQHLSGSSISESGYVGNSSGDDVKNATLQDAADSKKKQMVEAKDEESSDDVVIRSQQAIIDIYNLLEEVAHGSQSLRVRVVNNANGAGGTGGGSGSGSGNYTIGDGSSVGSTGGLGGGSLANSVNGGADNGNWVLSF
jgi:hypothetical protein